MNEIKKIEQEIKQQWSFVEHSDPHPCCHCGCRAQVILKHAFEVDYLTKLRQILVFMKEGKSRQEAEEMVIKPGCSK